MSFMFLLSKSFPRIGLILLILSKKFPYSTEPY
jgi:hypothetical protein